MCEEYKRFLKELYRDRIDVDKIVEKISNIYDNHPEHMKTIENTYCDYIHGTDDHIIPDPVHDPLKIRKRLNNLMEEVK